MDRAADRRESMLLQMKNLNWDAEIIQAIDGSKINRDQLNPEAEQRLSNGEIGCYLSHVKSWQEIIRQNLDYAIILEDDVICHKDMMKISQAITETNIPFDVVRLSSLRPIRGKNIAELPDNHALILPNKNPSGTQGYMASLNGAKRMLEKISIPRLPIDTTLDAYWKNGLIIPIVSPILVAEDPEICSSISHRFEPRDRKSFRQHLQRVFEAKKRKIKVFWMAQKIKNKSQL